MTREVIRTRRVEGPLALLEHPPDVVWVSPRLSLVGWGEALTTTAGTGDARFARAGDAFADWVADHEVDDEVGARGTGPIGFGSFTFDARSPGSVLVVPRVLFGTDGSEWFITTVGDADATPLLHPAGTAERGGDRPRYAGASVPDLAWMEAVAVAVERIQQGPLEKVVLARDHAVWSKERFDERRVLGHLMARFPECFTFLVQGLVGASPELLLRRQGRRVESVALAGSARRDEDPAEDERIGKELAASDKNRREHEMAAASVGTALSDVCERLARDAEPELLRLANVQHLATRFRGVLSQELHVLELVRRLHPTAAVGGVPTALAIETIRELEKMERGRYAGPVGWIDRHGDGEFAIALRCAELSGARARLFAGAGIVDGSLPETELEETRLKLQAMLPALS